MKPFLLLATRAEDVPADEEYELFLRYTGLREDQRIGIGIFNQKAPQDETFEAVLERGRTAVKMFGKDRVLLNTDCGFATFADNPIVAGKQAEAAMTMLAKVRDALR